MKKYISCLIAFVLAAIPFSLCVSAAELTNGTYEVPVVLMHKEDEKESFGNKYVAQTALLEVEGNKKTITILLTTDMKGIEFSYYVSGSLEGEVSEGTPVSNIAVAGETYKQGFEIPVMTEGDIGLQFSVPVMPMSPSARLRIDYDKAVLVSATETTTVPATQMITETTTQISTTVPTTQVPTTTQVATTEITTVPTTQPTEVQEETNIYVNETPNNEINEVASSVFLALFSSVIITYILPIIIVVILLIIGVIVIKRFVNSEKKENNNNDDK